MVSAIGEKSVDIMGKLMFQAHDGLSNLYEVSCEELDFLVALAQKEKSVLGARMMGGGFGGCMINLIQKQHLSDVVKRVTSAYKKKYNINPEVYHVKLEEGTRKLSAL